MWLAGGAPMPQVRAEASDALGRIQIGEVSLKGSSDGPAQMLMAADIKRFLERPIDPIRTPTTFDAPPGAPIGDGGIDWLTPASWCAFDRDLSFDRSLTTDPGLRFTHALPDTRHGDSVGRFRRCAGVASGVDAGRKVFESRCARCHGADGNGGEMGPPIVLRLTCARRRRAGRVHSPGHLRRAGCRRATSPGPNCAI